MAGADVTTPRQGVGGGGAGDAPPFDPSGLMKGRFSLNHQALENLMRPILREILAETKMTERLKYVEGAVAKLQQEVGQKADAGRLNETCLQVQETAALVKMKADQKCINDISSALSCVEEAIQWKADQIQLQEVAASVQRVNTLACAKADLSYVNRTNSTIAKLTNTVSQQDKFTQDVASTLEKLESHHLPQSVQRTREQVQKNTMALKGFHDALIHKADTHALDDVLVQLKDMENSLGWKANHQSLMELTAEVHDMQHQFSMKADQLGLEDTRGELQECLQLLSNKAEQGSLNETNVTLQATMQRLNHTADLDALADTKTRLLILEAGQEKKADVHEMHDLHAMIVGNQNAVGQKAERALVSEIDNRLVAVEDTCFQKAEVGDVRRSGEALQRLEESLENKADRRFVTEQIDEVSHRFEQCVDQLRRKADNEHHLETAATLQVLAQGLGSPRGVAKGGISSPGQNGTVGSLTNTLGSQSTLTSTNLPASPMSSIGKQGTRAAVGNRSARMPIKEGR